MKVMFISVLYAVTFNMAGFLFAQQWQLIGPPGGRVSSLALNSQSPNTVYAGTEDGLLFCSKDGGKTSFQINSDTTSFQGIVISPLNPELLFAGVWRSTNGGSNWQRMAVGVHSFAFHPTNPNTIYGVDNNKSNVTVSTDAGITWRDFAAFSNEKVIILQTSPINGQVMYAATSTGFFRTADSGSTWAKILTAFPGDLFGTFALGTQNDSVSYVVTSLSSIQGNPMKFYRTTDAGTTWSIDSTKSFLQASPVNCMMVHPQNQNTIYLVTGDYVWGKIGDVQKSTDGGVSWQTKNEGLPSAYNRYMYALAINSQSPEELFVGSYGFGVYKSTDGGTTWQWTNVTQASALGIYCDPFHSGVLYSGTYDEGIMKTTNAGASWTLVDFGGLQTVQAFFRQIRFHPANQQIAYATGGPYGLLKSNNGGLSWQQTTLKGNSNTWAWSIAIHPTQPEKLYVGQTGWLNRDLYRSTDDGGTWEDLHLVNNESSIENIQFDPSDYRTIYVCADERGFLKSSDEGATWNSLNNGLIITDTPFLAPVISFADDQGYSGTLYVAQRAVGTNRGGIFKSMDGGVCWSSIDASLLAIDQNLNVQDILLSPLFRNNLYASLQSHGQFNSFSPGGVYLTTDGGTSWKRVRAGSSGDLEFDPFEQHRIYVATLAGIYTAIDSTLSTVVRQQDYPKAMKLYQNYPNPFNSETIIRYAINISGEITLKIFNTLGEEVRRFYAGYTQPGEYEFRWDAKNQEGGEVSSGVYFCRLETPRHAITKKIVLLR